MSFKLSDTYNQCELNIPSSDRFFLHHSKEEFGPQTTIHQIVKSRKPLLPVKPSAFEDNDIMPGWIDELIRSFTSYDTIREFYQSFDIAIGAAHPNWPGWHYCSLPNGWKTVACEDLRLQDHTPLIGSNRAIAIITDDKGTPHFGIVGTYIPSYPLAITLVTSPTYLSYNLKYPRRA